MSKKATVIITKSEIDGAEFKTMRQFLFYLKKLEISEQQYFDLYLKVNGQGECAYCQSPTKFDAISRGGYVKYCTHTCSQKDPNSRALKYERTQKALLAKYGVTNPGQMDGHRDKIKKTCLEKYGDPNFVNPDKSKNTTLSKYGTEFYVNTVEYKTRVKVTSRIKYGTDHWSQANSTKVKTRDTCQARYGVDHALQAPEVRKKIDETMINRYGGYTLESEELSEKMRNTMQERYGEVHPQQNIDIRAQTINTNVRVYGASVPTQNGDVIKRMKNTNILKYGVSNTFQLPTTAETFMRRYGVINASQLDDHAEKVRSTCLEKYGHESFFASDYFNTKTNGAYKLRIYNTIWGHDVRYQSIPELEFVQKCEQLNILIFDGPRINYSLNGVARKYYVDFVIIHNGISRLIEVKRKHRWWFEQLAEGKILAKTKSAQQYSQDHGFLPYKIIFTDTPSCLT